MSGVIEGPDDWRPGIELAVRKAPTTNGKVCSLSEVTFPHRSMQCEFEINLLMSSIKEGPNDWGWVSCWLSEQRPPQLRKCGIFNSQSLTLVSAQCTPHDSLIASREFQGWS